MAGESVQENRGGPWRDHPLRLQEYCSIKKRKFLFNLEWFCQVNTSGIYSSFKNMSKAIEKT
jgi:hypothetical protein